MIMGLPWERLAADDNVPRGGLLPFGLLVLLLSPMIAAKVSCGADCLTAMIGMRLG